MARQSLDKQGLNKSLPFFPSESAQLIEIPTYDGIDKTMRGWMWVQAFFPNTVTSSLLLSWNGTDFADDAKTIPLVNPIQLAYSGQLFPFRGLHLVASGQDYLGNALTASVIGAGGFVGITVYGGSSLF